MTASDDFSALRDEFWQHYSAERRKAALAVAERAWDGFPDRRGYAWMFLAVAHCGLGSADAALEVLERAESENHIWRLQLLRLPELESLRADPRFDALTKRAQARVASRNFQARLLLAEPEPAVASPTLLLGLHGATSTADEYHRHWLPATRLGCVVASAQSSQPATESAFCWDDRSQVRRDLESVIDKLPEHGEIVLTRFSQGALVAPGLRPETRPRDLALRWPRSKEPPSTGLSVFNIRAGRSAEGDAGDGSPEGQRSGWAFRPQP